MNIDYLHIYYDVGVKNLFCTQLMPRIASLHATIAILQTPRIPRLSQKKLLRLGVWAVESLKAFSSKLERLLDF